MSEAAATETAVGADTVTSVEIDGRVLSGVGVDADQLRSVMDARLPAPPADAPEPPAEPSEAPPPRQTRGGRRFDELTREREEARRASEDERTKREVAEQDAADWKAKYEASQRVEASPRPPAAQAEPAVPARAAAAPTYPEHLQSYDKFVVAHPTAAWDDYTDARADWRQEHIYRPQFDALSDARIEAERASRSRAARNQEIGAKGRTVFADFDAVVRDGPGAKIDIHTSRWDKINRHPQAHAIVYSLSKDVALAHEIAMCDPYDLGDVLTRVAPAPSGASSASPGMSGDVTPPPPMQPVGSGARTTTPTSADLAARGGTDYDRSGYREKRRAERGGGRRP